MTEKLNKPTVEAPSLVEKSTNSLLGQEQMNYDLNPSISLGREAVKMAIESEKRYEKDLLYRRSLAVIPMESEKHGRKESIKKAFYILPFDKFNPKANPGEPVFGLYDYMANVFQMPISTGRSMDTYKNTLERENWQEEMVSLLDDFSETPNGNALFDKLNIESLNLLSPYQAMHLAVEFVRQNSKYSDDMLESDADQYADKMDSVDLLKDGLKNRNNPNWRGNGVCRNIACNVLSVFEALKSAQDPEKTRLNNTYCFYKDGDRGVFRRERKSLRHFNTGVDNSGHAWNQFVDMDADGSVTLCEVDATWSLEDGSAKDYSLERTSDLVKIMVKNSGCKDWALEKASDYFIKVAESAGSDMSKKSRLEFAAFDDFLSLYRDLSKKSEIDTANDDNRIDKKFYTIAYEHAEDLDFSEIEMLYNNRNETTEGKLGRIISRFWKGSVAGEAVINRVIDRVPDDFTRFIIDSLGRDEVLKKSEFKYGLTNAIRRVYPDWLPPFKFDKEHREEIGYLLDRNEMGNGVIRRLEFASPDMLREKLKDELKKLCGDAPELVDVMTGGFSDYYLLANFKKIYNGISKIRSSDDNARDDKT